MLEESTKLLQDIISDRNKAIDELKEAINYKDSFNNQLSLQLHYVTELFEEEKAERKVLNNRIQEFCGIKTPEMFSTTIKRNIEPEPVRVTKRYPSRHETISLLTKRSQKLADEAKKKEDEAISSGQLAPESQKAIL